MDKSTKRLCVGAQRVASHDSGSLGARPNPTHQALNSGRHDLGLILHSKHLIPYATSCQIHIGLAFSP